MTTSTLSREAQDLIAAATTVIEAIPRGTPERRLTDHTVGCAALASDGKVYLGVNIFHFSGGPCAESVAFGNASLSGVSSLLSPGIASPTTNLAPTLTLVVAIANDGRGVINPCGRCRQMMFDYYPEIKVVVKVGTEGVGESAELRVVGVEELLPFAYVSSKWKA